MKEDSIIELYSGTLWEAEMIKSLLESEEIESFIKNSVLTSYAYEPSIASGVKVMISFSDLERAQKIVDDYLNNAHSK